jgi:hypothetical protein
VVTLARSQFTLSKERYAMDKISSDAYATLVACMTKGMHVSLRLRGGETVAKYRSHDIVAPTGFEFHTDMSEAVLRGIVWPYHGERMDRFISFRDIEKWGGKIMEAPNPSGPERRDAILSGKADAVFDEGVKSWGPTALNAGMRFLPINDAAARHMQKLGFPSAPLTRQHYAKLDGAIRCVDFSGWTYFCHADLPNEIAYNMAKAVELCCKQIPVDHFDKRPMTMREFCRGGEAGQLNIPLHPGAKKYFREKGYL